MNIPLSRLEYLAAHAPDVPKDFKEYGETRQVSKYEPGLDRIVRWRVAYAKALLKALDDA